MPILKIAHRGASGYAPENTLAAFDKALELGADMIECDIRSCQNGELVIMHDQTVDRTTNGKGKISRLALEKIKQLVAGQNELVPTLSEVLGRYRHKSKIMIDLKSIASARRLVKLINRYKCTKNIIITATQPHLLAAIKVMKPEVKIALAFNIYSYFKYLLVKNTFILSAKLIGATTVNIYYKFVDKKLVERAHRARLKINVFAPKTAKEINQLKTLGVDGIITNYPDLI